jgi:hypothetical protein
MQLPRNDKGQLEKYAWPGGYPIFYLDRENSVLCADCARKSDGDPDEIPQFKPIAADVNYEDASLYCDQCNTRIESAYAEDEAS